MIHSKIITNAQFNDALNFNKTPGLDLASMDQSHSDIVLEIDKAGTYKSDALITKEKNLILVVKTADCMPVIVTDNEKVGVIHIGWKGLENKIFYKTISNFNLDKLKVSIGPFAKVCCYEVKKDLEVKFNEHCLKHKHKIYLDLSSEIKEFCRTNNIEIEISNVCTVENNKYNSYRRDKTTLRQWSLVWI